MEPNSYVFGALLLFVAIMLVRSFIPRGMPGEGNLRKKLSPQLQKFLASLPLADDHPLVDLCQPWIPKKDPGYSKAFLPLWQTRSGEPSGLRQYIKLGSKARFYGAANTGNEQAFLGGLVFRVMAPSYESDRPQSLIRGRRAAEAVGFRYLDEATKFLHEWVTPAPAAANDDEGYENEDTEEDEIDGAAGAFVVQIEKLENQRK